MEIHLTDQTKQFPKYLGMLCTMPVIKYDKRLLKEKETTIEITTSKDIEDINLDFLFAYQIFPGNIMSSLTQWAHEKREMKTGDTIVQQVYIPPILLFSQKLLFGVRIKEIINEPARKGFSYETIEGHAEKGISIFSIEKSGEEKIVFSIKTFSEPATILTKISGPVFSLPYQAYCTKQALINVKNVIEAQG